MNVSHEQCIGIDADKLLNKGVIRQITKKNHHRESPFDSRFMCSQLQKYAANDVCRPKRYSASKRALMFCQDRWSFIYMEYE